jgi:guanylate kinase
MSSNFHSDGTLFIVSGPSGAGKTTLINRVREQLEPFGITLYFSVSHTTRSARTGESQGKDYYFATVEEFAGMAARGEFLEHAHVHGNQYGTSRNEVVSRLDEGQDVILDIDYQGARQVWDNGQLQSKSLNIFIFPPTLDVLEQRLRERGLNTDQEIDIRMRKAIDEIDAGKDFYNYVIINDDLAEATECLKAAIIAQKLKTKTALESISRMAERFKEERDGRIARGR